MTLALPSIPAQDRALTASPLFEAVEPASRAALSSVLSRASFCAGTTIFDEGDAAEGVHILLTGKVKMVRRGAAGREHRLSVLGPSDVLGELSVFEEARQTATATALNAASLAYLSLDTLQRTMSDRPDIAQGLLRVLTRRLRGTNEEMADQLFTDVPARVAKALLRLAEGFGTTDLAGVTVQHDLTQHELALLVGASRETVNKALSAFVARGWIRIFPRSVVILDRGRLSARAFMTTPGTAPYPPSS
jgi:CRP-like cAMP-binding protein